MPTSRGQVAVMAGDDGLIYVMGGFDGGDPPLSTVQAYNPAVDAWTNKAPMPWITRGAGVARGLDGIIYVISGYNDTLVAPYPNAMQAYNATSNSWILKASVPVPAWIGAAATGDNGKIYFFGGESTGAFYSNVTQVYDPVADAWTNGTQMPTGRRGISAVKGADGMIYVMGGYNGSVLSVVEAYDPAADTWTTKASMPSAKVEFGAVLGPDNKIYVIGGGRTTANNAGPGYNTVEVYDPRTDTWSIPTWSESLLPTQRKELGATLGKNGRIYAIGGAVPGYTNANEEALIVLQNLSPTAYIDSVSPNPVVTGQTVSLVGHGADSDGSITAYQWRSSINGIVGSTASLDVSTLSNGTHTVYFSVEDNSGAWSPETSAVLTVQPLLTDDPLYQKMQDLNSTVSDLRRQNADLTQKLDQMYLALLGIGIVTIVLVLAAIAVVFMKKRPPQMGPTVPPA